MLKVCGLAEEQAVPADHILVQDGGQLLVRPNGLQDEVDASNLHGLRVVVHAMDLLREYVSLEVLQDVGTGLRTAGPVELTIEFAVEVREVVVALDEEGSRAARRIQHPPSHHDLYDR